MDRTLAAAVKRFVTSSARSRGESYFLSGRVTKVHSDSTSYAATVRGNERYDVELTLDADRLVVRCTCPHFMDSLAACKHIWAAILAADESQTFELTAAISSLDVDEDSWEAALDDGNLDVFEDEGDLWRPRGPLRSGNARQTVRDRMKQYWSEGRQSGRAPARREPPPPAPWQTFLAGLTPPPVDGPLASPLVGELIYVFDPRRSASAGGLLIELLTRTRKKAGGWSKPKTVSLSRADLTRLRDEQDRSILQAVCGADPAYAGVWGGYTPALPVPSTFILSPTLQSTLVPRLCATRRLLLRLPPTTAAGAVDPAWVDIDWEPLPALFRLRIGTDATGAYTIGGVIRSGDDERSFADALFVTSALILWQPQDPGGRPRFAAFDAGGAERWMNQLLSIGPVTVPASDSDPLVETLATLDATRVDCPDELRLEPRIEPPRRRIRVTRGQNSYHPRAYGPGARLDAAVSFRYGDRDVDASFPHPVIVDRERRLAWRRDAEAEAAAVARLQSLGVRRLADWQTGAMKLDLAESILPTLVRVLLSEGWDVEADGRLYRRPGAVTLEVRSGIDWFELHGGVDFEGVRADLPTLLKASRHGDGFVPLGDGTFGLLPEEWVARSGRIAALGAPEGDHLRFVPSQTALLDAWLAEQPEVSVDEAFARARAELARFDGIADVEVPATFNGTLRGYQRDALAWFQFLRRFGFGGCLADEMGLGKTVMVLAVLESLRLERERGGGTSRPSLVVVPRSLVFNWLQEAARFAPALRVLDLTGGGRRDLLERVKDHDVVVITYGTLRRDIGHLKDIAFQYAILDEAQAIKNARTSTAKAARLLSADHRLALSGTPVENHLGELWSLLDFLNPGMLGAASIFSSGSGSARPTDDDHLAVLARGVRPFILRRTKEQVAAELPARTEQTLYCDLEPAQRALYDELRDHYRASLLGTVARVGLGRAKLQVLEALLRLRQAACHPALIDPARIEEPAAKLDVLLPRLQELVEDGRKVLIFSQFTMLLALLRTRLDEAQLKYEYLDGKTKDRQARVDRFQNNGCPLFLISLKAGGLGLNLTAAEYVFLLDPWWNPAVEAQAIDRAHRIGQTRPVFAFRLIARGTVEEKVLELQTTKRHLADAIVRADESLIRDLKREDLELLLS